MNLEGHEEHEGKAKTNCLLYVDHCFTGLDYLPQVARFFFVFFVLLVVTCF